MPTLEPIPDPPIPGRAIGQRRPGGPPVGISAGLLKQIIDACVRQIRGGDGTNINYYGDRVVVETNETGPTITDPTTYTARFSVLQEMDDYLICSSYTQAVQDELWVPQVYSSTLNAGSNTIYYVAKPFMLQKVPWDKQTVDLDDTPTTYAYTGIGQRTANGIAQSIQVPYFPGDVIVATRVLTGIYGPTVFSSQLQQQVPGQPIMWMDLNTAGRAWIDLVTSSAAGASLHIVCVISLQR